LSVGVIPIGGARDAKQVEDNAGALGWRLTNEEIAKLESHPVKLNVFFLNRLMQRG
jgi:aryl-alcohol dehydrogenase-like predicted oxidoreductase